MKKYFFISLSVLLASCASKQTNYKVVNAFLEDKKFFNDLNAVIKFNDTIIITNQSVPKDFIKLYKNWSEQDQWDKYPDRFRSFWPDTTQKFKLPESEIALIADKCYKDNKTIKWDCKKLSHDKIIIADEKDVFGDFSKYNVLTTKSNRFVYSISKPIYSKANDVALFALDIGNNASEQYGGSRRIIIVKKKEEIWKFVGYINDTTFNNSKL